MRILAFIPARAGSMSIENKNMALLDGEPLISYCIEALKHTDITERVCSTDSAPVANLARRKGLTVVDRPKHLRGPIVPIVKVIKNFVETNYGQDEERPDAILLVQPTSPFVTPYQIQTLVGMLSAEPDAQSAQTICKVPHNFHTWNQRTLSPNKQVAWIYPQRSWAYNKESKPASYKFGNLVLTRTAAIIQGEMFPTPSLGLEISLFDSIDVDGQNDLDMAEALVQAGVLGMWTDNYENGEE